MDFGNLVLFVDKKLETTGIFELLAGIELLAEVMLNCFRLAASAALL